MTSRAATGSREAAGAEVEELLGVDLGDRRGVGAAHVVGEDLQAGDRVGVGVLGQQQVARLLEGVGLLGVAVDLDHAAPDGARAAAEDAAEREVGVQLAAACSCVVSKSRCWRPGVAYAPVTLPSAPSPSRIVFWKTLPLPAPKPRTTQSNLPSRATFARWVPKIHGLLVELLGRKRSAGWRSADDELDDGREQAVAVGGGVLLPDLGLRALLEHDQRAHVQRRAGLRLDGVRAIGASTFTPRGT